jgi:hypothetical protein
MDGFWTYGVEYTPDRVKYKAVGKFEPKVLVWCAISEAGVSTPFLGFQAVDADFYMSVQNGQIQREAPQKLRNKLLAQSGIVPLCKETLKWLEQKNIKIEPKAH